MLTGFIDKLPGGIDVVHLPAEQQWGDVDLDSPPKGCGHTTEGTSLPSYRSGQTDAPTFTIGPQKVWQHRALGKVCGTLQNHAGGTETNRLIRIQFELIGFSTRSPWLPARQFQRDALAAIKELAHDELGVPANTFGRTSKTTESLPQLTTTEGAQSSRRLPVGTGMSRSPRMTTGTGVHCDGTTSTPGLRWSTRWHL